MTICGACGGEIEFRYMNGRPTPIHMNGGGCFGFRTGAGSSRSSPASSFMTAESYINPSACCPVCGQRVFYFQSRQGGRVFFDDVGWPWPKHPCTDNKSAHTRPVGWPAVAPGRGLAFRGKDGERLDIYELETMTRSVTGRDLKFRRIRDRRVFRVHLSNATMKAEMLEEEDFREAPSFVASPPSPGHSTRAISFICARLKRVVALELPKIQPLAP